jgi:hypothetical protein|eukprot:SAG25_NODE_160_length_13390_cov_9.002708_6_plen_48_part_00
MDADVKFTWRLTIPKGCRQATKIAQVSHYADESEVCKPVLRALQILD